MCADIDTQTHEAHMYDQCDYRCCWNPEKAEGFIKQLSPHESVQAFVVMELKLEDSIIFFRRY